MTRERAANAARAALAGRAPFCQRRARAPGPASQADLQRSRWRQWQPPAGGGDATITLGQWDGMLSALPAPPPPPARPARPAPRRLLQVCGEQREGPGAALDAQPQVLRRDRAQRVHAQAQGHRGARARGTGARGGGGGGGPAGRGLRWGSHAAAVPGAGVHVGWDRAAAAGAAICKVAGSRRGSVLDKARVRLQGKPVGALLGRGSLGGARPPSSCAGADLPPRPPVPACLPACS